MKIEIWGTYPPPLGGVSMHIKRLAHKLQEVDREFVVKSFKGSGQNNPDFVHRVKNKYFEFFSLPIKRKSLIHLHTSKLLVFFLIYLLGKKHSVGITLHNKRLVNNVSPIKLWFLKRFFKRVKFIILNDPGYKDILAKTLEICDIKIFVFPAYIKPLKSERGTIPDELIAFRSRKEFLLSANAYMLKIENNIDVYGLDMLINLVENLKMKGIDVGLVFCLPKIGDEKYFKEKSREINEKELSDNILILNSEIPNAFQIWEMSDIFIRPTSTDIEGISVKEALEFGTPTIASDICIRPKEAILFKSRDDDDLLEKVIIAYNRIKSKTMPKVRFEGQDTVQLIADLYTRTIS